MPAQSRGYSKDEELGKRDDDFRPKRSPTAASLLQPWRWRKRRLAAVFATAVLVFLIVRNLPDGIIPIGPQFGIPYTSLGEAGRPTSTNSEPTGPPPRPKPGAEGGNSEHYHDGPVRYYRLASSLHAIARTMGARPSNRNVLFAVSSLQSAANLMPMACEMAKWDRNYVNMAFLGRDSLPIEDILEINGVTKDDCTVYFHDARSDYSEWSSDLRAEISVGGAMKHINDFMHPQAIIMDDSAVEDTFFTTAVRGRAKEYGRALIEVPAGRYEEFLWMTRLDSGSLGNWFKPTIDILVHAPPDSSGGLMRLVKSLRDADYAGLRVPKLTIELPSDIEPFARRYLERLDWPPVVDHSPLKPSTLTLHHRIPSTRMSSEQASVRFVEMFYPNNAEDNHVLVLSPQAELSPLFLQYLHYQLLEYKYSSYGSSGIEDLLGMSLDVPSTLLNGTSGLVLPAIKDMRSVRYKDPVYDQAQLVPFLYGAPSASAALIFGDKWIAFHDFLTNRLTSSHTGRAEKPMKLVSETEPSWLEYLLELMRARGWGILHPANSFVTMHNELSQIPEEFMRPADAGEESAMPPPSAHPEEEPFLTMPEVPATTEHIEREPMAAQPLHDLLPFEGDLPELPHLPYLSYAGDIVDPSVLKNMTDGYVLQFRHQIGGCEEAIAARKRVISDLKKTEDLFCLPGQDLEFDLLSEKSDAEIASAVIAETSGDDDDDGVNDEEAGDP